MIPNKIYLPKYPNYDIEGEHLGDDWSYEPEFTDNVTYIRKDALLEWAKEKQYESLTIVADNFWQEVIDKLNSL